jgi:hypothetical protein
MHPTKNARAKDTPHTPSLVRGDRGTEAAVGIATVVTVSAGAPPECNALGPELGAQLGAAREHAGFGVRETPRRADIPLSPAALSALYVIAGQVDAARRKRELARGRPNPRRRQRVTREASL